MLKWVIGCEFFEGCDFGDFDGIVVYDFFYVYDGWVVFVFMWCFDLNFDYMVVFEVVEFDEGFGEV